MIMVVMTQLYDYGCDDEYYYIVMKRYPISLKKWRIQQKQSLKEMLPTYLSIFKDILQAVQIIHNNNTTHYDLKCDNIVLDFDPNEISNYKNNNNNEYDNEKKNNNKNIFKNITNSNYDNLSLNLSSNSICIRVADFGECKIFLNEKDEYCTRSRGTDVIKSPEMLHHFGPIRKEDDNFDRRKKIGTTRSSDIWSLGCLFYELLTGKFLFEEIQDDYMGFIAKIDNSNNINDLLTNDKLSLINNNPYLVDFLKFMLIKEQNYRPNIETVIKRFEHVYALLVGGTGTYIKNNFNDSDLNKVYFSDENFFSNCIENCEDMIFNVDNSWDNSFNKEDLFKGIKSIPEIIMLTKDIFLCEYDYIEKFNNGSYNNNGMHSSINNACLHSINSNEVINNLLNIGITHIISFTPTHNKEINEKFFYLNLLGNNIINQNENNNNINNKIEDNFYTMNNTNQIKNLTSPFGFIYSTLDFLRHAMIYKGKVLFVDDYFYTNIPNKPNFFIRSIYIFKFKIIIF